MAVPGVNREGGKVQPRRGCIEARATLSVRTRRPCFQGRPSLDWPTPFPPCTLAGVRTWQGFPSFHLPALGPGACSRQQAPLFLPKKPPKTPEKILIGITIFSEMFCHNRDEKPPS